MASSPLHSKLINQAARDILRPLGLYQMGRSRLWIDDHGWWLIGVAFEPSGFSRGTYLCVYVHWLWHPEPGLGFHFGGRIRRIHRQMGILKRTGSEEFVAFQTEEQFVPEVRRLATRAAGKVLEYRSLFPTLASVTAVLRKQRGNGFPRDYHIAVAYGLLGQIGEARRFFDSARIKNPSQGWHVTENDLIRQLDAILDDTVAFRAAVNAITDTQRQTLKLDATRAVELPSK